MDNLSLQLSNIYKAIKEYGVIDAGITVFEACSPKNAVALETVRGIIHLSDHFRLNSLLRGLSDGYDTERKLDELYSYVSDSERAFFVSDCFRKLVLAQSPVVCCILGLILSDSMRPGAKTDSKNAIIMNAIISFTDYDLRNFQKLMSGEYDIHTPEGIPGIHSSCFPVENREELELTLELCIQTRIMKRTSNVIGDGNLYLDFIQYGDIAKRLNMYISRARTQLRYGER